MKIFFPCGYLNKSCKNKLLHLNSCCRFAEAEFICHCQYLASMLTIPYEPRDNLSLHVEVFDGKFYLRRIIDERNFKRLAECLDDPKNAYSAMRTRQGIKLCSHLRSGKNNIYFNACKTGYFYIGKLYKAISRVYTENASAHYRISK